MGRQANLVEIRVQHLRPRCTRQKTENYRSPLGNDGIPETPAGPLNYVEMKTLKRE